MKAYVIITGTIFGLVTAAHVWRIVAENSSLVKDVPFVLLTACTASLCIWAARLSLKRN